MNSIIQADRDHCFLCGRNARADYWGLDEHHCFSGPYRKLSEKYGLKVYLCHDTCHLNGVHKNKETGRAVKRIAQQRAMQYFKWDVDTFIKIFGKSYI